MLEVQSVHKEFTGHAGTLTVLADISFVVGKGEAAAVVGPSGSGKTTLLGLCAGLDTPSGGSIRIDGEALQAMDEDARARVRNERIGFVFQNFQLIPTLTALENVCVPLELKGVRNAAKAAREWLGRVGLAERPDHYPVQLSGGEQQRVAIARACVAEPALLFADEPTGNLDGETREQIESLLFEVHRHSRNTLVIVTHDLELAARTQRILHLRKGRLEKPEPASAR
ncbi:MAG: ATP-binding cassette domain-containing protein [Verrucomicrobia bacterium]|jgi:putative ABC transport system ATP-binding protein|nr:ATP-binding cassette domain-containing protein [Verrucomicrobiota bacterium]